MKFLCQNNDCAGHMDDVLDKDIEEVEEEYQGKIILMLNRIIESFEYSRATLHVRFFCMCYSF